MRCWLPALLLQLVLLSPPWAATCPARCECAPQLRSVVCHRRRLSSIPEGIPTETRILELSKNRIRCLNPGDLSPYPLLEELDLSENIISNVEPGAFGNLFHLQTLRLRGNQLKLIPPGVFTKLSNLTLLDLSENKLVILLDYVFQDLRNLKSLQVGDNDLVYISPRAFWGLLGLEELTIEKCNLTSISGESLSSLQNLEVLRLRHLSIPALEEHNFRRLSRLLQLEIHGWPLLEDISPTSFQGLNLTWLSITYTNITAVPAAALRNLAHLRYLNLSYNPIGALPRGSFRDLVRLQELHIAGALLASRRKTLNFDGRQPVCSSPPQLRGDALRDLPDSVLFEFFTCQKPKIRERRLQHVRAREGQAVSFLCRADGEPDPAIAWVSPQHRLITSRSTGRATVLPGGTLEIRFAQVQDSGTYICVASNAGGNDTYFATLTVEGRPGSGGGGGGGGGSSSQRANRTLGAGDFLNDTARNDTQVLLKFTLDLKTILVSTAMGCITFLGVVLFCFLLLFVWSRGRGQHKNNFSVEYSFRKVDGPAATTGQGGARKFNMKMI
ncbi:LIGO3 protein, partial [Psilopogon haemacephalus]|nr:LIGO3 protein [Psilopogon haemacephalus]